jgi:hypothetical protein
MKYYLLSFLFLFSQALYSRDTKLFSQRTQFLTVEKARQLLSIDDAYTLNWSQFDLDARVHKKGSTKAEQIKQMQTELREWTLSEKDRLKEQFILIDKLIANSRYRLIMPDTINFIKSTLKDEGGAEGYTRGNQIVLKNNISQLSDEKLQAIIIHELFHVLTRYNAQFRKDMYKIIGFTLCNEIAYPENLKNYKISNPDAPFKDSFITLTKENQQVDCMMILYANADYTTGSFFDYLTIGLLKLKGSKHKEIDYIAGKAQVYSLDEVSGFFEQVGKNTGYIIDPEEALADNFVFALQGKTGLDSQWIVFRVQQRLKQ